MKEFIKKQSVAVWISLATVVLALVSLIVYGVTLATGDGVVPNVQADAILIKSEFGSVTALGVLGLIFIVISIVGSQFKFEELLGKFGKVFAILGKVCDVIVDAFRLVAPALFILMIVTLIEKTYNGIGWSLGSNEVLEINPEAVKTCFLIFTTAGLLLVSSIVGMVAAFFNLRKKENKEAAEATAEEAAE